MRLRAAAEAAKLQLVLYQSICEKSTDMFKI
nr:MAG TPA: hypothetical protein [Caudoviricetes sp.]